MESENVQTGSFDYVISNSVNLKVIGLLLVSIALNLYNLFLQLTSGGFSIIAEIAIFVIYVAIFLLLINDVFNLEWW